MKDYIGCVSNGLWKNTKVGWQNWKTIDHGVTELIEKSLNCQRWNLLLRILGKTNIEEFVWQEGTIKKLINENGITETKDRWYFLIFHI